MNIIKVECLPLSIFVGYERENDARGVAFDYSAWTEQYGDGVLQLLVQRPGDADPYPVVLTAGEDGTAVWSPSATDTAAKGWVEIQLIFMVGSVVAKTAVLQALVDRSLTAGSTPPDPYETWLETLTELAEQILHTTQPPEIRDGYWYIFDPDTGEYVNSGVKAEGEDGVGITGAQLNADYTLTLNFSDGTSYTTPSIRGAQGPQGPQGPAPTAQQIASAADEWLEENVAQEAGYVLDRSLTMQNAAAPADLVGDLQKSFNKYLTETTFDDTIPAHETDKYVNNQGNVSVYNGFAYSDLIPVKKGDLINATLACPASFYAIWYATDGYATKEHAVSGTGWTADDLVLISDRDGYIFCNYYYSQPHTLKVTHYTIPDLQKSVKQIEETINNTFLPIDYDSIIPTHESGKYLTQGGINSWEIYSYSNVISIKKGDFVSITAYIGPGIYGYYCAADYSFRQNAFVGDTYAVKTYTFIADRSGYLAINFATAYTHTIKILGNVIDRCRLTNPLYKKTVLWCGDSLMRGNTFNDTLSGWAGRCASMLSFNYRNYGVGGSTICNNVPGGSTPTIYEQIEAAYSDYPNADYIIFDGGCNDADLIGSALGSTLPAKFGTWSPTDWSGLYDIDTFCGSFETICMNLSKHWLGSHVGFIVPHKMGVANDYSATGNNYRKYYETAIEICKKWGIPVLNLWDGCYLNPKHSWMCDTNNEMTIEEIYAAGFLYADRQHLTSAGYDYEATIVSEWLKGL